ncbi:6-phosphofructokinase [bacterium]|nr:6-phosphofructokinase [bacterium]
MTRIGLLTSGGDAPGMNAGIRAVVRTAFSKGCKVIGIHRGYSGLLEQDSTEMESRSVGNIIQRGGTILRTSRCEEMREREGRVKAGRILKANDIDGLIVIGGDGSFRGAHQIFVEEGLPVVGVPGTIDNDLYGTDYTIGYDTAIETALDCIDKIRDTAASHDRLFFIEVMGHHSGFIAMDVGIAGGAEEILIPNHEVTIPQLCERIMKAMQKGKRSNIIVVAEGEKPEHTFDLAHQVQERMGIECRVAILGHIQRGGSPSATDRVLATKLGYAAVNALLEGTSDIMVGEINGKIQYTPLQDTWEKKKPINPELIDLAKIMAL